MEGWDNVLAFVGGGVFTAAIAEWRARAAEGRARLEREAAWQREQEVQKTARLREAVVRDIQETRSFFLAEVDWHMARLRGRDEPYPGPSHPNQDLSLTGDASVVTDWARVSLDLLRLNPGDDVPAELVVRLGVVQSRVMMALKQREADALADKPLPALTVDEMTGRWIAELQARFRAIGIELPPPSLPSSE